MIPSGATVLCLPKVSRIRPSRSSVQLLPVWLAWSGFAPSSSPQSPLVDAARALVHVPRSCHRAFRRTFSCSPPTGPPCPAPQAQSRPSSSIPRSHARKHCHAFSCSRQGVSGPRAIQPLIFTRYPLPGRRIRTTSDPYVHLHSLSAARKAYPDPGWSSRSSSLAIRRHEGVSGPQMVQPFIFIRYPPPGRRIRTPRGPGVQLHSPSTTAEGVSGPRAVQAFIFTRYPPPGRRVRTPSGLAVHLHSPSTAGRAYPDRERSSRLS